MHLLLSNGKTINLLNTQSPPPFINMKKFILLLFSRPGLIAISEKELRSTDSDLQLVLEHQHTAKNKTNSFIPVPADGGPSIKFPRLIRQNN